MLAAAHHPVLQLLPCEKILKAHHIYIWDMLKPSRNIARSKRLEVLGVPSQKTTLLGGVAQILIPKIIPVSSRCETICSIQIPTIPARTKSLPASLTFLRNERPNAWSGLFTAWGQTRLTESPTAVRPLIYTTIKYLASQIVLQGLTIAPSCAKLGNQKHQTHGSIPIERTWDTIPKD